MTTEEWNAHVSRRYGGIMLALLFVVLNTVLMGIVGALQGKLGASTLLVAAILRAVAITVELTVIWKTMRCVRNEYGTYWFLLVALLPIAVPFSIIGTASAMTGETQGSVWVALEVVAIFWGIGSVAVALHLENKRMHEAYVAGGEAVVPVLTSPAAVPKSSEKTDTADLDKEREERLREVKEAAEDPENMLDEITVQVQEREIEADYQRKLAERKS